VTATIPIDIPVGTYTLILTAIDADGNQGSDEVDFEVQ